MLFFVIPLLSKTADPFILRSNLKLYSIVQNIAGKIICQRTLVSFTVLSIPFRSDLRLHKVRDSEWLLHCKLS